MENFLILLSPSKSMSEINNPTCKDYSVPIFIDRAALLAGELRKLSLSELENLLGVSFNLAQQNWVRYQNWSTPFSLSNSRQAILSFSGDVYDGLSVDDFNADDFRYSQVHLRILSGLYGLLNPLDLIQPYRLEMGSSFKVYGTESLYHFWSKAITEHLNGLLNENGIIVNLASNEYFRSVDIKTLKPHIVNIEFRENRPEGLKVIPILSKKARGLMSRYAIKSKITDAENLKFFDYENYRFSEPLSTAAKWVFIR